MNKLSGFGAAASVLACAGVVFAVMEMRKMASAMSALEDRLAKVEGATSTVNRTGEGGSTASAPATLGDVAQDVVALKEELAKVRSAQEAAEVAALDAKAKLPVSGAKPEGGGVIDTVVREAVEAALAKKDQEAKEKEAKRTEEWQGRMGKGIVDYLSKELGLTEQQKEQVTTIVNGQMTAFRDAMTNRKEGEDMRTTMETIRKDTDEKVKAVLTSEQVVKYDEVSKQMQSWGGGGRGGFGGGGPGGGGNTPR